MGILVKRIGLDLDNDTISIGDHSYPLDTVRRYMLVNHEFLCQQHLIRCIITGGKRKFSFDWQGIFKIAHQAGYFDEFVRSRQVFIQPTITNHVFTYT